MRCDHIEYFAFNQFDFCVLQNLFCKKNTLSVPHSASSAKRKNEVAYRAMAVRL